MYTYCSIICMNECMSHTSPIHCSKMSLPPGTWPEELSVSQTPGCLSHTHLGLLGSHGYQSCSLKTLQRRNQLHKLPYPMLYLHMHKYLHRYIQFIYIYSMYVCISYTYIQYVHNICAPYNVCA